MADIIDVAQDLNELHLSVSLKNHCNRVERAPAEFDGKTCVECGDAVEPVRLSYKFFRCAGCQDMHERDLKVRAINGRDE